MSEPVDDLSQEADPIRPRYQRDCLARSPGDRPPAVLELVACKGMAQGRPLMHLRPALWHSWGPVSAPITLYQFSRERALQVEYPFTQA